MSAEPAHPGPDGGADHAATVFAFRRPRRREAPMPPRPDPAELTPEQKLAAWVERAFADHRRTLTDDDTAEAFLISINLMRRTLDGALTQGLIDKPAHADLAGMLEGMAATPGLLA